MSKQYSSAIYTSKSHLISPFLQRLTLEKRRPIAARLTERNTVRNIIFCFGPSGGIHGPIPQILIRHYERQGVPGRSSEIVLRSFPLRDNSHFILTLFASLWSVSGCLLLLCEFLQSFSSLAPLRGLWPLLHLFFSFTISSDQEYHSCRSG